MRQIRRVVFVYGVSILSDYSMSSRQASVGGGRIGDGTIFFLSVLFAEKISLAGFH